MPQEFKQVWRELGPDEKTALSKKLGTSVTYLSNIAHGHQEPGKKMIKKLCSAGLGLTADMFL